MQYSWPIGLKPPKLISLFGILTAPLLSMNLDNPQLIEKIKHKGPWLTLGIVADSEKQSTILPKGRELRKQLETAIQDKGGEILIVSLSERMKLERLWTLPYTGRFSKPLRDEARSLGAGIMTGSYINHDHDQIQLIVLEPNQEKVNVFHLAQTETSPSIIPAPDRKPKTRPKQSEPKWIFKLNSFEPSRETPRERRKRHSDHESHQNKLKIKLHHRLITNPVLQESILKLNKEHHIDKPLTKYGSEVYTKTRDQLIQRGQQSFMTSSKIEYLSRAYLLNEQLPSPDQKIKEELISSILSHQIFIDDPRDR